MANFSDVLKVHFLDMLIVIFLGYLYTLPFLYFGLTFFTVMLLSFSFVYSLVLVRCYVISPQHAAPTRNFPDNAPTQNVDSTPVSREACERCRKHIIYDEVMSIISVYQYDDQEYFTKDQLITLGECFFHLSKMNDSSINAENLDSISRFFEGCSQHDGFQTNDAGEHVPLLETYHETSIDKFRKVFWELYKDKYDECISIITEFQAMNNIEQIEFVNDFYGVKNNFVRFMFGDFKCDIHN